jgi:dihydroneopterin aldolase
MDRILITAARLPAHIGVTDEERAQPQTLVFDITLLRDLREAGRTDDYTKTVCYAEVVREIEDILTKPFHLIEAVAESVAARVLSGFAVDEITVRVAKPGAFPDKPVDHAAVEITRRRNG